MSKSASLIACALAVLLLAGCGGLQPEDPAQALRDGGAATAKLKTVTATLKFIKGSVSFRGFKLVSAKAAVMLPSDSDTTYMVRQKDLQIGLQVVITGGHVFIHLPFTTFQELTGQDAADIPDLAKLFDAKAGLPAVIPAGSSPKYVAVEQVDGVDSHKVEATYTPEQVHGMLAQLSSAGPVDAVVWVGGSDHLIRKAVLSGAFGDNGTDASVEVDLSGFDAKVSITSPSP